MPLIKSNNAPSSAVPFSLRDIESHAQAIIEQAKTKAQQMLAAAAKDCIQLKLKAHAEGVAAGRAEGLANGTAEGKKAGHQQALNEHKAQLAQSVAMMQKASEQVGASLHALEADATADVIQLAVAIARKTSLRLGAVDESVVHANVNEALRMVIGAHDLRIFVHPSQLTTLQSATEHLKIAWPNVKHVEIVGDAALAPGGCRIATLGGLIDGDLNTKIDRIVADLVPGAIDTGHDTIAPTSPAPANGEA